MQNEKQNKNDLNPNPEYNIQHWLYSSLKLTGFVIIFNVVIIIIHFFTNNNATVHNYIELTLSEGALLFIISPLFLSIELRHETKKYKDNPLDNELKKLDSKYKLKKININPLMIPETNIPENKDEKNNKEKNNYYGKIGIISGTFLIILSMVFDVIYVNILNGIFQII